MNFKFLYNGTNSFFQVIFKIITHSTFSQNNKIMVEITVTQVFRVPKLTYVLILHKQNNVHLNPCLSQKKSK